MAKCVPSMELSADVLLLPQLGVTILAAVCAWRGHSQAFAHDYVGLCASARGARWRRRLIRRHREGACARPNSALQTNLIAAKLPNSAPRRRHKIPRKSITTALSAPAVDKVLLDGAVDFINRAARSSGQQLAKIVSDYVKDSFFGGDLGLLSKARPLALGLRARGQVLALPPKCGCRLKLLFK